LSGRMKLNVVAKIRITPDGVDSDLDAIRERLEELVGGYGKLHKSEMKPIAFGLNSIEATLLLDDSKGGLEEIESSLKEMSEVSQVDVVDINLL